MKGSATLKGLILDLRGNYGGVMEEIVQVGDLFLPAGVISIKLSSATKTGGRQRRPCELSQGPPQAGFTYQFGEQGEGMPSLARLGGRRMGRQRA